MAADIATTQNSPESLRLLVAQSFHYRRAKRARMIRLFFDLGALALAALVAVAALSIAPSPPLWIHLAHEWGVIAVAVLSFAALLAGTALQHDEDSARDLAASIQEAFDTTLFRLPWNEALGERPPPEAISESSTRSVHLLKNWYATTPGLPHAVQALLCQRQSATWDGRAHRQFAKAITASMFILFLVVVGLLLTTLRREVVAQVIAVIALPFLPLCQHALRTAADHRSSARAKDRVVRDIESVWSRAVAGTEPAPQDLRRVQDRLYLLRQRYVPVPEIVYRVLRTGNERVIGEAAGRMAAEYRDAHSGRTAAS